MGPGANLLRDILAPFADRSGSGEETEVDPVDYIQKVAAAAVTHADVDPHSLTEAEHGAVDRLREFAGELAIEANARG